MGYTMTNSDDPEIQKQDETPPEEKQKEPESLSVFVYEDISQKQETGG